MSKQPQPSIHSVGSATFTMQSRWRFWAMLGAIMVGVVAIGIMAMGLVKTNVRSLVASNLTNVCDAAKTTTHDWMVRRTNLAVAMALRPPLLEATAALIDGDGSAAGRVRQLVAPFAEPLGIAWWALVDADGRILVSPDANQSERLLPADARAGIESALKDVPILLPPVEIAGQSDPLFLACAKICAKKPLVLMLASGLRNDFARMLSSHPGTTGEVYAFDAKGRMLTESRFTESLRGRLLPTGETSTIFNVELRDSEGAAPGTLRSALPFTRPVLESLAGRNGIDLEGYMDYRGHRVLGAWHWCKEHQIGIAVKMDCDEAYRALDQLVWLNVALVALILVAGVAVAIFVMINNRLARRARHAERTVKDLGQYQLERKLGEGGMGAVYLATHRLMRRKTAVKMISGRVDAETIAKFEREVRLCCLLSHPNTIAIYDYGHTADNEFYYAMECLSGLDLQVLVERFGPMPPGRVIHLLIQACGSLAEAHRAKLLHRDIKPANIFVTERGGIYDYVKVLDFGLVKKLGGNTGSTLSQADIISGTPPYMAPEVINQRPDVDGRADLYALGLVGYFLLTGKEAFTGGSAMDILMAHLNDAPPKPSSQAAVPADLEAVIMRCLLKDPQQRWPNADLLSDALMACADARGWGPHDARKWWEDHPLTPSAKPDIVAAPTAMVPSLRKTGPFSV